MVVWGWATARISATDGVDIVLNPHPDLGLGQPQVLQDRVTPRPGGRGEQHGRGELLVGETEVAVADRQRVVPEAAGHLLEVGLVLAQEETEGRADAGQLAV